MTYVPFIVRIGAVLAVGVMFAGVIPQASSAAGKVIGGACSCLQADPEPCPQGCPGGGYEILNPCGIAHRKDKAIIVDVGCSGGIECVETGPWYLYTIVPDHSCNPD